MRIQHIHGGGDTSPLVLKFFECFCTSLGWEASTPAITIEVIVQKDLEDVDRSQYSTESSRATRHDGTVVRRNDLYDDSPVTLGWIPMGRDTSLEQVILSDIFGRITQADRKGLLHH